MQNCVCANCAPPAIFFLRLTGCQSAGGSTGMSATPMKKSALPPTARPYGSCPLSRMDTAVATRALESRSNTGLASG